MLVSNRAAIRYKKDEIAGRDVRSFESGKKLSYDELQKLAS